MAEAREPSCHTDDAGGAKSRPGSRPIVALVGRPNSGKSSLFNRLTGAHAHVGNFPGITVDILEATIPLADGTDVDIVDLPGLYSVESALDPDTDEGIARRFLDRASADGRAIVIVHVLDATQLALGLRLTRELTHRSEPLLVVASQADLLRAEAREIDVTQLSQALSCPTLALSARDVTSRDRVLDAVSTLMRSPTDPVERAARSWTADETAAAVLVDLPHQDTDALRRRTRSERIDRFVLHPVLGLVLFISILGVIFSAVFLIADPITGLLDGAVSKISTAATSRFGRGAFVSFLTAGILGGAGTVLAFLPQIVILTIALELLEASGYLSRGAFLVDRMLRVVGLGGRAFVPLLMGHACAVPAISATRIMRDPRERLVTMLVLPLMTCSARIPVYSLLVSAFFGHQPAWVRGAIFLGLYFSGIVLGLVAALVMRRTVSRGRPLPLVLEMPSYRTPQPRDVARVAVRAGGRFLRDVGTNIVIAAAVLWALLTVPMPGSHATGDPQAQSGTARLERSVAAGIARATEPLTAPLGFDWRINVGLIASFGARELMVGTMGIIFGIEDAGQRPSRLADRIRNARRSDGRPLYRPATALALLAFFVIACQCMSTVAAIRRETRTWRWPAFVLAYTYLLAYIVALAVHQIAGAAGAA